MSKLTVYTNRKENIAGGIYFCLQMFILPYVLQAISASLPTPLSSGVLNFIYFSVNFISVAVIFHKFLYQSIRTLIHNPWHVLRYALLGFAMHQVSRYIVAYIIIMLNPTYANLNDTAVMYSVNQNYTLMSIGVILLAPFAEEVLYRGVVFGYLYRKNPVLGYVVSAIVFSLIHILGYIHRYSSFDLLCNFLIYLPAGISLAFAYEKSGTIVAPMLAHMAINQLGILNLR